MPEFQRINTSFDKRKPTSNPAVYMRFEAAIPLEGYTQDYIDVNVSEKLGDG